MVLVEELLECDDCGARINQTVEDEQIGLLAGGGEIHLYCKACRNISLWHYPRVKMNGNGIHCITDPLLETFEYSPPTAAENFPPDPLLIDYQGILNASDPGLWSPRVQWDWAD